MAGRSKEMVYVSSTFVDLERHRAALKTALERAQYDVECMEKYPAFDERPVDKCLADVAACDVYVLLVAHRYGYVPAENNPHGRSITELEYDEAVRLGKPRLVFCVDEDEPWPPRMTDKAEPALGRLNAFRQRVGTDRGIRAFSSPADLASLVLQAQPEMVWDRLASRLHGEAFMQRAQPRQRATGAMCCRRRAIWPGRYRRTGTGWRSVSDWRGLMRRTRAGSATLSSRGSSWRWCSSNKATAKRPWTTPRLDCASPSG